MINSVSGGTSVKLRGVNVMSDQTYPGVFQIKSVLENYFYWADMYWTVFYYATNIVL